MPQNPATSTNPGVVNVADQGDGLTVVDQPVTTGPGTNPGPTEQTGNEGFGLGLDVPDQPVTTGPSTNPGPLVQAGSEGFGLGTDAPDQPVTVSPAQTAQRTVDGGLNSPVSPDTINTTQNTVVNQIYDQGNPTNVFV
jgi:hypothetical protein